MNLFGYFLSARRSTAHLPQQQHASDQRTCWLCRGSYEWHWWQHWQRSTLLYSEGLTTTGLCGYCQRSRLGDLMNQDEGLMDSSSEATLHPINE